MAHAADSMQPEFWRPPLTAPRPQAVAGARSHTETCQTCGTEFVLGARFCHVCGAGRDAAAEVPNERHWMKAIDWITAIDMTRLREMLHLSTASLIAMFFGVACVIAAVVTSFLFEAKTLDQWEAIQAWRIEWLLAAAVAFILGILLKPREA
jgi:hypothetical protein